MPGKVLPVGFLAEELLFFPQQHKLMGSSAQNSSGVPEKVGEALVQSQVRFNRILLSSYSFSSTLLSSDLSLLSASALLCFSSVHIVGSLTSKLPSTRGLLAERLYEICPQALDKRCFGKPSVRDFLDRFQQISNQVYKPIEVPLQNLLEVALHKLFGRVLLLARTL